VEEEPMTTHITMEETQIYCIRGEQAEKKTLNREK
jgi:hypothetical protein